MPTYELAVILVPQTKETPEDKNPQLKALLEKAGAKVGKIDLWGKKKLAYPIAKNEEGIYAFFNFEADGKTIAEVDKKLHLAGEVIRYLILRRD